MPFNKFPSVKIKTSEQCTTGWDAILHTMRGSIENGKNIVVDCYQGVHVDAVVELISEFFGDKVVIVASSECMKSEDEIISMTFPYVTDDRIFGFMTNLKISEFFDDQKVANARKGWKESGKPTIIVGVGAAVLSDEEHDLFYIDMARWEIQLRMRQHSVTNIGLSNSTDNFETQYKRGFFLDWRVCDDHKRSLSSSWDYILDTNKHDEPKMISAAMFSDGMEQTVQQPFSVVPFFDPGPWGGQWMREKFELDAEPDNFAWCFNCVPEENSLLLDFDGATFETPSINLVFFKTKKLLGQKVEQRFGAEFPIRFDFLDTIDGGNLSLQVHPLTDYIQDKFGVPYTQDESYYMLDAKEGAQVYLGLKENVDSQAMIHELKKSQSNGHVFNADEYAQKWPAKKHDHFLIPAGTVHCSGTDCMVLEISATPYIFTFKLWDWGRVGLDGKPRPINIERGEDVIQWNRQPDWTSSNLINQVETIAEGEGWREERTGLHELEFIETRRHWHSTKVTHQTGEGVNVLMIVEGEQAIVESPKGKFEPFLVNYAEAFIIPASVDSYTITPCGRSEGKEIGTVKAFVRVD